MKKLEPRVRAICNELIDEFIADGRCDAAARYAKHIPVRAIAHMLGIPEKDGDLFIKWIHEILELGIKDQQILIKAAEEMDIYFAGHIEHRKTHPSDDLISTMMNAKTKDGKPLDDDHVLRFAAAAPDCRHRHHLERDRRGAVASRQDAVGSRASGQGTRTDADRRWKSCCAPIRR